MAELAEVVEHIEEDFPFSILKDLNHNGLEMNPRLVLINEAFLNQGIRVPRTKAGRFLKSEDRIAPNSAPTERCMNPCKG